jgi:hypothetical protein
MPKYASWPKTFQSRSTGHFSVSGFAIINSFGVQLPLGGFLLSVGYAKKQIAQQPYLLAGEK